MILKYVPIGKFHIYKCDMIGEKIEIFGSSSYMEGNNAHMNPVDLFGGWISSNSAIFIEASPKLL
jgi:hypothetical protein